MLNEAAAFECLVLPSNPPPIVQWMLSNVIVTENSTVSIVDDRYLYFTSITSSQLGAYRCEVINALINTVEVSPTTYNVADSLPANEVVTYKPIGDLVGSVGEVLSFIYVGGYRSLNGGSLNNGVVLGCEIPVSDSSSPVLITTVLQCCFSTAYVSVKKLS